MAPIAPTATTPPPSPALPELVDPIDFPGSANVKILVDSVGYAPAAVKVVTIQAPAGIEIPSAARVGVIPEGGDSPVASATVEGPTAEPESGDAQAWTADISAVKASGTYRVRLGQSESPPFAISAAVYPEVFAQAVHAYYLQRCGVAIDDRASGVKHAACHLDRALLEQHRETRLEVNGGWHDAGDYGRYIPTAAVTLAQMFLLAEAVPAAARHPVGGIGGAGGVGEIDLITEARYELDWMLKMQRADGGVYHKVTTENFPGFILPEDDHAPLLVYGVSSAATAMSVAALARAARYFLKSDAAYAEKLAGAAVRGWSWLRKNPGLVVPPVGNTGAYLSGGDRDCREWAAAELFALTGEATYEAFLKEHPRTQVKPPSWDDTADLTLLTYVSTERADPAFRQRMIDVILAQARERVASARRHPYGVALGRDEYHWASAKLALAVGEHLLLAHRLQPDPAFLEVAAAQLHWVLGRNPLGRSFVTGLGANPPLHPHHRLVAAGGKMVPGLLVGGPNARAEDGIAPANRGPRSYVDDQGAYSVNEPAIDYNAPLVFVAGWLAFS